MNRNEVLALGRWMQAACPQQKWDKLTPEVWSEMLGGYSVDDAKAAARALVSRQPFISLAELIAEIKKIRGDRIRAAGPEVLGANVDPDDVPAYLVKHRADVKAVGDGSAVPDFETHQLRPVGALVATLANRRAIGGSRDR